MPTKLQSDIEAAWKEAAELEKSMNAIVSRFVELAQTLSNWKDVAIAGKLSDGTTIGLQYGSVSRNNVDLQDAARLIETVAATFRQAVAARDKLENLKKTAPEDEKPWIRDRLAALERGATGRS